MVRKKSRDAFDKILDSIEKKIETTGLKDIAFTTAWISGSYTLYFLFDYMDTASTSARQEIYKILQSIPVLNLLPPPPTSSTYLKLPESVKISLAMFMSYKILTTDLKGLTDLSKLIGFT